MLHNVLRAIDIINEGDPELSIKWEKEKGKKVTPFRAIIFSDKTLILAIT